MRFKYFNPNIVNKYFLFYHSRLFFLPNWSISIDFRHHFFSSADRPIVSNFPESVVLYHVAFSKSDASSTLVKLLTLYKTQVRLSLQENAFLQVN